MKATAKESGGFRRENADEKPAGKQSGLPSLRLVAGGRRRRSGDAQGHPAKDRRTGDLDRRHRQRPGKMNSAKRHQDRQHGGSGADPGHERNRPAKAVQGGKAAGREPDRAWCDHDHRICRQELQHGRRRQKRI
ncbi:hypothetical protein X759_07580 [Mesorhizobium sp. LSHC420B00]|nr:hypothetical protein X759_07580 [Mesorhizobium sp. LSHC420B00]